jgi:eukaryotic-like serine/threonine-protein kinase
MIAPDTLLQNRYLVQHQIGQGGMGAVYVATDQRFGSTVALKETFFDDPNLRKAFEREARLLNHLRHPALPRVSDHFTEEQGQFIVMEYIAGDDLAEKLRERGGAFPLSEVLNWADQLLDALDYLHTQEPTIIHRDIKPQNLKLTPRKHIVLLDFGLAKGTLAHQTTATKSVFGYSRHYAPLEQIQGAGTDPRSDLYSLAATLYHLMTGLVPPDALTRATAVLNGQPDPLLPANDVHAQVTPAVAGVIQQAMAQNAGQRPQSAAELRELMREAARQVHTVARDASAPPAQAANVYEQDTQLMFAAAPATRAGGQAAGEPGTVKDGGAGPTSVNSKPSTSPDSLVTRVAAAKGGMTRGRVAVKAAGAAALLAVAAGVYTLTRDTSSQAPATEVQQQNVLAPSPTPEPTEAQTKEAEKAAEKAAEVPPAPVPAASPVVVRRKDKPAKEKQGNEGEEVEIPDDDNDETPETPDTDEPPNPGRRAGNSPPAPGTPEFEEYIEEQTRRAEAAAQRAERVRRRAIIQRQLELERQRRQQRRQQQRNSGQ